MRDEVPTDLDQRHPVHEATYKGWLIRYRYDGEWIAELYRPGSGEALPERLVASADEGETILIQRAQRAIDSQIDDEPRATLPA